MELFLFDPQQRLQIMPPRVGHWRFALLLLQETQVILAINRLPVFSLFYGYLSYSGIILLPLPKDKKEKRTDESSTFMREAHSAVLLRLRRLFSQAEIAVNS